MTEPQDAPGKVQDAPASPPAGEGSGQPCDAASTCGVLDALATGVMLCERDGSVRYRNNAAANFLSGKADQLLDLLPPVAERSSVAAAVRNGASFEILMPLPPEAPVGFLMLRGTWLDRPDAPLLLELHDVTRFKQREQELDRLVCYDELTGVVARRHFHDLGRRAFADMLRYGNALCVMMIDLDHFKRVNDECGHAVGDQVLHFVAETIKGQLRRNDVVGRLGGEEFGVLLPNTTIDLAEQAAERVRSGLEAAVAANPPARPPVTVSIGVASCSEEDGDLARTLARADEALYAAKRAGRNRVASERDIRPGT